MDYESIEHDSLSDHLIVSIEETTDLMKDNDVLLPYRLSADDGITGILFFCFFLFAYVLANGKKILLQKIKDFFHTKERGSLFADSTLIEVRYRLLLVFQTCILLGIGFFDYFYDNHYFGKFQYPPYLIIGIYTVVCILYYLLKWNLYSFLVWIFIDKTKGEILLDSYFFMISCLGFLLFPIILLGVYFDLPSNIFIPIVLVTVSLVKILFFYKCIKLFFNKLYGLFSIILYFCALELMLCFLLLEALIRINNLILIKF